MAIEGSMLFTKLDLPSLIILFPKLSPGICKFRAFRNINSSLTRILYFQ